MLAAPVIRLPPRLSRIGNPFAQQAGPMDRLAARVRRPADRFVFARLGALSTLRKLGASVAAEAPQPSGLRVLVLSIRGWPAHAALEAVIAQALRLRGAEVAVLTCGGGMPACEMGWGRRVYPRPCDRCAWHVGETASASRLPLIELGPSYPWGDDPQDAPATFPADLATETDPRASAMISTGWFLKATEPERAPHGREAATDLALAAAGVDRAAAKVLDSWRPDVVFMVNGLFAAEQTVGQLARARGIRVTTYEMAPRAEALVFANREPAALLDTDGAWAVARGRPLDDEQSRALDRLLAERAEGVGMHEGYFDSAESDADRLRGRLEIPRGKRVIALFTNLSWDSAAHGRDVAYPTMMHWIHDAARVAAGLDDVILVIRVHPAEARWGSHEQARAVVEQAFGSLPANVRLVDPTDPVSSYALLEIADQAQVYASTVGIEAAVAGVRVGLAAAAHYRGRGFTTDLETPEDLAAMMAAAAAPMSREERELARRYAFTFFFRYVVPFPVLPIVDGEVRRAPAMAREIAPGADPYLDFVCDRIFDGEPFVLPDELTLTSWAYTRPP